MRGLIVSFVLAFALALPLGCSNPPPEPPHNSTTISLRSYDEAWEVASAALASQWQGDLEVQDQEQGTLRTGWRVVDDEDPGKLIRRRATILVTDGYTFQVDVERQYSDAHDEYGVLDRANPRWTASVPDPTWQLRIIRDIEHRGR